MEALPVDSETAASVSNLGNQAVQDVEVIAVINR